jgi:hypothetical protein
MLMSNTVRFCNSNWFVALQNSGREALSCVEKAAEILAEDISAPLDIQHRLRICREAVVKT